MIVSAIVAVAENGAIGRDNQLPWHLPEDLKFFKRTTMGKPVLMGRKTYDSLGKPLPGRLNIVVSNNKHLQLPDGVLLYHDLQKALERLEEEATDEVFIIGGGKIFAETIHLLDQLYITKVHTDIADANAFFPHIDHSQWKLVWEEEHLADEKHAYPFTFQHYKRVEL